MKTNRKTVLSIALWLVAVHSLFVAMVLLFRPQFLIDLLYIDFICERFLPAQAGIFHIVLVACYIMAAIDPEKFFSLVIYSVIVKSIAFIYLLTYYFTTDPKWLFLVCGIVDGAIAIILYTLSVRFKKCGNFAGHG